MTLNSCQQQDVPRCEVPGNKAGLPLAGLAVPLECLVLCSIIASERGHTQVVNALLKQNANIQACTRCTPCASAVFCSFLDQVQPAATSAVRVTADPCCLTYMLLLLPAYDL